LRRSAGGGEGSSLIAAEQSEFFAKRETKKIPSLSSDRFPLLDSFTHLPMTKRLLLPTLAFAAALTGGCLFSKSAKPKEPPSMVGENEASLRQRWIERRAAELVAQGVAADAARAQAAEEFRAKYSYPGAAQK
jgi:hypothetical protein